MDADYFPYFAAVSFFRNCIFQIDLAARCNNHKIGRSIKKDPTKATIVAGDAIRAECLKNTKWMFKSTADDKSKIN